MQVINTLKPLKVQDRKTWGRFKRGVLGLIKKRCFKNYCNRTIMSDEIESINLESLYYNTEQIQLITSFSKLLAVNIETAIDNGIIHIWIIGFVEDNNILKRFITNLELAAYCIKAEKIKDVRLELPLIMGEMCNRRYQYIKRYAEQL